MNHVLVLAVALLVSFAMAMVLSPSSDPYSMLLLWAPMFTAFAIFYFIGVLAGRRSTKGQELPSDKGAQASSANQLGG